MIMGDGEVERDAPVDVCLQRLEADSGQVDVLNSTLEGARTAVCNLHKKKFPRSRNDRAARKVTITRKTQVKGMPGMNREVGRRV